jgi:hypothetical protein
MKTAIDQLADRVMPDIVFANAGINICGGLLMKLS